MNSVNFFTGNSIRTDVNKYMICELVHDRNVKRTDSRIFGFSFWNKHAGYYYNILMYLAVFVMFVLKSIHFDLINNNF